VNEAKLIALRDFSSSVGQAANGRASAACVTTGVTRTPAGSGAPSQQGRDSLTSTQPACCGCAAMPLGVEPGEMTQRAAGAEQAAQQRHGENSGGWAGVLYAVRR
jgi:hypothetical protein